MVLLRHTKSSRTNTKKDVLFIKVDWNAKVGSQETPGITGKFDLGVQNKAGQRLIEFCQENALIIATTLFQQLKIRLYMWTSPDGQYQNQIDYILCSQRWITSIQSAKTRFPGEGNGHPFRYSCLENSMDRGAWWGPWGCKELDTTERLSVSLYWEKRFGSSVGSLL